MPFAVPSPCSQPWAAMPPTPAGRHCGSCQHEVVDFSRLSDAEIMAWLARPNAGTICGYFRAGQFAPPTSAAPRWRRWLVAAVALLGLKPLLAAGEAAGFSPLRPVPPRAATEQADTHATAPKGQLTIWGRVLDDSTGQGMAGVKILIGDTPYGTVTDEQGNFRFTMLRKWSPVQQGRVQLRVQGNPFVFERQTVTVQLSPAPAPLTVRLKSMPGRGHIMGKPMKYNPPQKPPLR